MVARLKLKGIDGRAPPGVEHRLALAPKSRPEKGFLLVLGSTQGDTLKLPETPAKPLVPRCSGKPVRGTTVKVVGMVTIQWDRDNGQPSATCDGPSWSLHICMQFTD
jgi:hypothetical protein